MKKISIMILPIILIGILLIVFFNNEKIVDKFSSFLEVNPKIVIDSPNEYTKEIDYEFVQINDTFIPYSKQDLLNIIYSFLNNGWEQFTFYCPNEYESCIMDLDTITRDNVLLSNINNYVHPFNSFTNLKTSYSGNEVTITIDKLYTKEKIQAINVEVDKIISENIQPSMSLDIKIKTIHDYLINNTHYDIEKNNSGISQYDSTNAYGTLLQNYAICGGYSDAMAIFLSRFDVNNYKVASETHVWNAVYLDGSWLHLDLTWDDPYDQNKKEYLLHKYFLITTSELETLDSESHNFDKTVFQELNK